MDYESKDRQVYTQVCSSFSLLAMEGSDNTVSNNNQQEVSNSFNNNTRQQSEFMETEASNPSATFPTMETEDVNGNISTFKKYKLPNSANKY